MFRKTLLRTLIVATSVSAIVTALWALTFPAAVADYTVLAVPLLALFFFAFAVLFKSGSTNAKNWSVGLTFGLTSLVMLRIHDPSGLLVFAASFAASGFIVGFLEGVDALIDRRVAKARRDSESSDE